MQDKSGWFTNFRQAQELVYLQSGNMEHVGKNSSTSGRKSKTAKLYDHSLNIESDYHDQGGKQQI
jgi:hypothetical protein